MRLVALTAVLTSACGGPHGRPLDGGNERDVGDDLDSRKAPDGGSEKDSGSLGDSQPPDARAGDAGMDLSETLYPRLQANIFSRVPNDLAAYRALSHYDAVTTGRALSNGSAGGVDLGSERGFGPYSGTEYNFRATGSGFPQRTVYEAKQLNPNLTVFAHRGLAHLAVTCFEYGTTSPERWFCDSLSPRWFAYSRLSPLTRAVTESDERVFYFDPALVREWVSCGAESLDSATLPYWTADNSYDWFYLSFIDNEAGAGRGTVEVMVIRSLDRATGRVEVATRRNGRRTIYGSPQRYPVGSRAGIVPHGARGFGARALYMNRAYPEASAVEVVPGGPTMSWIDAEVSQVARFFLPSAYPASGPRKTFLTDGVLLDADDERWRPFGFRFADPLTGYCLDLDLDGVIDEVAAVQDQLPRVHDAYAASLSAAAATQGRTILMIVNGRLMELPRMFNGRRYEDFNGGFEDSYREAIDQYTELFEGDRLADPRFVLVSERDRESLPVHNFAAHRHILAITLIFGDGHYGHDGAHATRIAALDEDWNGHQPEDWFDEFSVDSDGYSSLQRLFHGAERASGLGWLGRALGRGRELTGASGELIGIHRRDFEHGIAIYAGRGGAVELEEPFHRICGADPDNDGSVVTRLDMVRQSGIVLVRGPHATACPR